MKLKQQVYEFTSYHSAEKTISLTIFKLHTDRPTSHAFKIVMKIGTLFSVFHCRRPRESIRVIWTECQHVSMTRAPSHLSYFILNDDFFLSNDQRLSWIAFCLLFDDHQWTIFFTAFVLVYNQFSICWFIHFSIWSEILQWYFTKIRKYIWMITVFLSNNFNQLSILRHIRCVRFSSKLSGRSRIKNDK